jgi:hypothetical protein
MLVALMHAMPTVGNCSVARTHVIEAPPAYSAPPTEHVASRAAVVTSSALLLFWYKDRQMLVEENVDVGATMWRWLCVSRCVKWVWRSTLKMSLVSRACPARSYRSRKAFVVRILKSLNLLLHSRIHHYNEHRASFTTFLLPLPLRQIQVCAWE